MEHQTEELSEMLTCIYLPDTRYAINHQMKELSDMLTCQVCWETLTHPIYRCKFEHLLCPKCFPTLTKCPSCREQLEPNLRSLSMERLADLVRIPCEYSDVGCPELLQPKTKQHHEETCGFGPGASVAQCPLVYSCSWLGSLGAIEQHVYDHHQDELVVTPDGAFTAAASSTALLEFDSALFVLRAESVTVADFTSHYVHVGHVAQGLRAAGAQYRFKVRQEPDGAFYKGHVSDYRQSLQELAAAGSCLSFVTQVDKPDEVSYSGAIKRLPFQILIE
ncbi:E3 ubiquitin-protein ligase siah-1-like [Schistocerca piceifrons]|uniref:E3 ubiquitin-protein ligase siah-1-like n=1 Tax=Schistocerca piceifrons TaxID=274613 RepID=UPI001F5E9597|nr:E3 ubiquitin-protein ligase siah-1-like [Schistocerca piceifrons]